MSRRLTYALWPLILAVWLGLGASEGVWGASTKDSEEGERYYIVKDGDLQAVIVNVTGLLHPAAYDLNDHIERATGQRLPIVSAAEAERLPDHILRIVVGLSPNSTFARSLGLTLEGPEAFRVVTRDNYLFLLAGADTPDTAYWSVSYFLDHYLGVRWLWPGDVGTHVPRQSTIPVPEIDVTVVQELEMRLLHRDAVIQRLPLQQQREAREWFRRYRSGSRSPIRLGHCFRDWWDKYHRDHPDYFAYPPPGFQQMPPDRVKLNVGNPAVADRVVWEWQQAGAPDHWCVGPNDSAGFSISEESRALDNPPDQPVEEIWRGLANLSARYVRFWNSLLERMKPINPNVTLSAFAYTGYREPPPPHIRLHEGMVLGYVHTYWSQESWLGWQEAGAKLILRPNWWHMGAVAPHLPLHRQGEFFRFARENGMLGFSFDTLHGYWGTQGPLYYLIARLSVRPDLTVEDILDEYTSAFGAAAPAIREYLDFWEDFTYKAAYAPATGNELVQDPNGLYETLARTEGFPRQGLRGSWYVIPYLYTDELLDQARAILKRAEQMARDDDEYVKARIQFLWDGLEHLELTREVIRYGYEKTRPEGATLDEFRALREKLNKMRKELTTRHVIWGPQADAQEETRGIPTTEERTRGWVAPPPSPETMADGGLLPNTNFELVDEEGIPAGWEPRGGARMNEDVVILRGAGPGGQNVVRVTDTSTTRSYGLQSERVSVVPGGRYVASVWGRVEPGGQGRLFLQFYDESGRQLASYPAATARHDDWALISIDRDAPEGAATARIALDVAKQRVGTFYFFGPSLREVK